MLKGSLDEKDPKFSMKNKIYPVVSHENNKVTKTIVPSNLCVTNQIGVLLQKPN